jgi:hypothetical protein
MLTLSADKTPGSCQRPKKTENKTTQQPEKDISTIELRAKRRRASIISTNPALRTASFVKRGHDQ